MATSNIIRLQGSAPGRSRLVSYNNIIWTVANTRDISEDFDAQVHSSLQLLDSQLNEVGSDRAHILSLQVLLQQISDRGTFDKLWLDWIGENPSHWPQRACYQAELAPGLLIELIVVAAVNLTPSEKTTI